MQKFVAGCGLFLLGLLAVGMQQAKSQESKGGGALQVHVNYTGSGTVDATHKLYVVLWDSPDFVSGGQVMPVEIKPVTSKDATAIFASVAKSPAYVSAVFDPTGGWDGQSGPPPTGASLGLYSKTPGKPEPVDAGEGKKAAITLSFDDSMKMP